MKKTHVSLFPVIAFYALAGTLTCGILFLQGSSLPGYAAPRTSLYDIKPELLEASQEPESSVQVTPAADSAQASLSEESLSDAPVFYAFTTLNVKDPLHVRLTPSMNAQIIGRLSPGATGFVIEKGPIWSLVQSGGLVGYVYNEYLDFQEIPREEYPLP